jgi:hypothetical protein
MEGSYRSRIAAIATRASSDQVFGAGLKGHRFELTRHSNDEITLLEEQLGIQLPEEYAQVLTETGSGAGPYYGLFPPGKILQEIESLKQILLRVGIKAPCPSAPFPFQQADADEICARGTIERSEPLGKAYWLSDGCIPICSQGCTFFSALVTAGELRGKVWSLNDDGAIAEWRPGVRPPGLLPDGSYSSGRFVIEFAPRPLPTPPRPPTFIQWYESWLERLEIDLDDYNHFKSQDRRR